MWLGVVDLGDPVTTSFWVVGVVVVEVPPLVVVDASVMMEEVDIAEEVIEVVVVADDGKVGDENDHA